MNSSDSDVDFEVNNFCDESVNIELESEKDDDNPPLREFELLDRNEIMFYMLNEIYVIVNILMITNQPIVRCLLNHYKWNKEQLIDDYYNSDSRDVFFQSVGIQNPTVYEGSALSADVVSVCKICFEPFSETQSTYLICGHHFCVECMCQYLKAKVLDDGEGDMIKCPAANCSTLFDDDTIMNLVADEYVQKRFQMLITNTFVLCNPLLRWCRTPDCEYAFKATKVESSSLPVLCNCGFEWCFQCGELCHDSITCALLERWIQYSKEDTESELWIQENSKKCPKCTMNIEKNGGCNHMTCKACRHEFCWLCMGVWVSNHSCNHFEPQKEANVTTLRLSHYNSRYQNHIQSLKLEHGLYDSIESKMKHLQGMASLTRNEVLFLKRAVESLRRSRQMLTSTYVFAYYAERSNQLLIFEDNQRDLETATESLSWYLEQDITSESMIQIKQKLQEKYSYCDQRRNVLLDHIHEGYERKYWKL